MSDHIRLIAVKKEDMDKIDFTKDIYWLDTSYMRISPFDYRIDGGTDKHLSNIINSGKKIVEDLRIPCIVKPKTMYNYIQTQIKPYEETLKGEKKPEWFFEEIIKNYYDSLVGTLEFIEKLEENEYLILRI